MRERSRPQRIGHPRRVGSTGSRHDDRHLEDLVQSHARITTIPHSKRAALLLGFVLAGTLLVTAADPASAAQAAQDHEATRHLAADPGDRDAQRAMQLRSGLELIESVPDGVLESGDAATTAWFREHHSVTGGDEHGWNTMEASVLGCTAAIAIVIASTAVPAAKILRIKRLIDELGGVATAVQIFWGASFSYEKLQAVGGAALALAGELLGITSIQRECFS
jgi:hypothetical protein